MSRKRAAQARKCPFGAGPHVATARVAWECPFRILIDRREQVPYTFTTIPARADEGGGIIRVYCSWATLGEGDYSIADLPAIKVERKSCADLWSTVAQGRDRFEAELARLHERCEWAAVVVEAEWSAAILRPGRCELNPRSLTASIDAWMQRFYRVHWVWCPDRDHAEVKTFRLLWRFWRDRNP